MWHIFEKERVQGYQIGYSQRINRGSYKDKDKDKVLYTCRIRTFYYVLFLHRARFFSTCEDEIHVPSID